MTTHSKSPAHIVIELFLLLFGTWTMASNLAVILQLEFKYLPYFFLGLLAITTISLIKIGFFNEWKQYKIPSLTTKYSQKEKQNTLSIVILILAMMAIALFSHSPALDDAHYIRTSVDMVDHPEKAVLLMDALGLFEGAPLIIPVYKAHSIETLCASISQLTGYPVIYIFHYFLPMLGAIIVVLVYFLLFRILFAEKAVLATILSFIMLLPVSLLPYGNYTFTHLHLGKGYLVAIILPIIIYYGLKATTEKGWKNWFLLALAQIVGIGMNGTALWLAPVVAGFAVIAGSLYQSPKSIFKNLAFSILTSTYIILFGIYIISNFHMPPFYVQKGMDTYTLFAFSFQRFFKSEVIMILSSAIILFTWVFTTNRLMRIISLVFPILSILIFYNPLISKYIAKYLVSEHTYWRTLWIIPFQLFLGIIAMSPFLYKKAIWQRIGKSFIALTILFTFLFYSFLPKLLDENSRLKIKSPTLKVTKEYAVAEEINTILNENDMLISPNIISLWISCMHHHPQTGIYRVMIPNNVIKKYVKALENGGIHEIETFEEWVDWYEAVDYSYPSKTKLSQRIRALQEKTNVKNLQIMLDYENRLILKQYISGNIQPENSNEFLSEGIDYYKVTAICLPTNNKWKSDIIEVMIAKNFYLNTTIENFDLWLRKNTMN
ncbi:MAG: hypothetical protein GQ527_08995 [Bacteroidales bacterium]|nr:hypothetical protein [Bacteroidales bacterium]